MTEWITNLIVNFTRKQERGKLDWNQVRSELCYYVCNSPRHHIIDKSFGNREKFSHDTFWRCTNLGMWDSEHNNVRHRWLTACTYWHVFPPTVEISQLVTKSLIYNTSCRLWSTWTYNSSTGPWTFAEEVIYCDEKKCYVRYVSSAHVVDFLQSVSLLFRLLLNLLIS